MRGSESMLMKNPPNRSEISSGSGPKAFAVSTSGANALMTSPRATDVSASSMRMARNWKNWSIPGFRPTIQ